MIPERGNYYYNLTQSDYEILEDSGLAGVAEFLSLFTFASGSWWADPDAVEESNFYLEYNEDEEWSQYFDHPDQYLFSTQGTGTTP